MNDADYYELRAQSYLEPEEVERCGCGDPLCPMKEILEQMETQMSQPGMKRIVEEKAQYFKPTLNELTWRDRERRVIEKDVLAASEIRRVDAQARLDDSQRLRTFAGIFWGIMLTGALGAGLYWLYTLVRG